MTSHQAQAGRQATRDDNYKKKKKRKTKNQIRGRGEVEGMNRKGGGSLVDIDAGSSLLLLGEFQSVAEDLDSLLLMTGSTCLGKLTVEAEHLPAPERTQHTTTVHKAAGVRAAPPDD